MKFLRWLIELFSRDGLSIEGAVNRKDRRTRQSLARQVSKHPRVKE